MSLPATPAASVPPQRYETPPSDAVEAVVQYIPVVLPVVAAIMIFLLAMIAVTMA